MNYICLKEQESIAATRNREDPYTAVVPLECADFEKNHQIPLDYDLIGW